MLCSPHQHKGFIISGSTPEVLLKHLPKTFPHQSVFIILFREALIGLSDSRETG